MTSATANYAIASDMTAQLQQCARNFMLQVQVDGKKMEQGEEGQKKARPPLYRRSGLELR